MKNSSFGNTRQRFRDHLNAAKTAGKSASISTEQGKQESKAPQPGSADPEVKAMTPHGGDVPPEPKKDLGQERGVADNEKLQCCSTPSTEQKVTKETAPSASLKEGSIADLQNRLASNLKLAADAIRKSATEIGSEGGVPPVPSGGKDLSLGTGDGVKGDATGSQNAPTIPGTQGVTQTSVSSGGKSTGGLEQGTREESVKMAAPTVQLNLDKVAEKAARFATNMNEGRDLVHKMAALANAAALTPEQEDILKEAAAVEMDIVGKAANALMELGIEEQILSPAQAAALMEKAGFSRNPLHDAIMNVQEKIAELLNAGVGEQQVCDYLVKSAEMGAEAGAPEGMPPEAAGALDGAPDPAAIQQAIQQLLQELHQAVESGQMSDEQAVQILREHGLPVDEMLGAATGGGEMGGGPEGATPQAQAVGDAMGAAPAAPSIAGDAPVMADAAPAAPCAPSAPKPDTKPEGKSEGGEKKKDEDDKDKEASRNFVIKMAQRLGMKVADEMIPQGAASPVAGEAAAPSAPEGMPPEGAPDGGAAAGDQEAQAVQALMSDLQKAVEVGVVPAELADAFMKALAASAGAGGDPSAGGDPAAGAPPQAAGAPVGGAPMA